MAAKKKSIQQKKQERNEAIAKAPKLAGKTPLEKLVNSINTRLAGGGRVYLGGQIQHKEFERRSSGIPSIDFITSGGYPRGGLIEIGGEFSVGKTSLALEACAHEQRTTKGRVGWVALEPFSKKWARERGFFLPFSEEEAPSPLTGEMSPIDPFENASELEVLRMQQAGIEDPYTSLSDFVLVQEERGDVALDAALDMIKSNLFAYVIVDSLGIAKSTKWLEENEVQDAGDFPREAKMIGDYTARALLALNKRYDENGEPAKDGEFSNQTTVIHLNQITTAIGTQARAKHKTQTIKGGEGNKHNHHCIIFLWKGELYQVEQAGNPHPYRYAQEVRCIALKSKLGPDQLEGTFDLYKQPYGPFQTGDYDKVKDLVSLATVAGLIQRSGAWYSVGEDLKAQGLEGFSALIRENPEWYDYLHTETLKTLRGAR